MEATELINWRKVGITLSGHPEGVRSTYSGKKYERPVNELKNFVAQWMATYSKAGSARQKIKNNLQEPLLNEPEQLLSKHAVNISVCECEEPKFSQYIDFCLNCGLPPKED